MARKKFKKDNRKRNFLIQSFILLFLFIGIGYATLNTALHMQGQLHVKKHLEPTLYNAMLEESGSSNLAKKYTSAHRDSFMVSPSRDIYYWTAANTTESNQLDEKINVLFADHCWKMFRTTDTGGIKMIYNGEAQNDQCLDNRGTHVGYNDYVTVSFSGTMWYGTDYTYESSTGLFSISGETERVTGSSTTGPGLFGKYTCRSSSETGTCTTLYLVEKYNGSSSTAMTLTGNQNYIAYGLSRFNTSDASPAYVGYMYSSAANTATSYYKYVANGATININTSYYVSDTVDYDTTVSGEYTLTNPQLISSFSNYSNLVGYYLLPSGVNTSSTELWYIYRVYDNPNRISYSVLNNGNISSTVYYGSSYTDNGNGTYTINNPSTGTVGVWANNVPYPGAYYCDNGSDTCSNIQHLTCGENNGWAGCYNYGINSTNYLYGEDVFFENGTYQLIGDTQMVWDIPANTTLLSTHHYTCLNPSGICSDMKYMNYYRQDNTYYRQVTYFSISPFENITDALAHNLSIDTVNVIDSPIKFGVEMWYKKFIYPYDQYVEDTIYCNDRSNRNLGPMDPNGGNFSSYYNFFGSPGLSCTNETDQFSVSNPKASLRYKVGLITREEVLLLDNGTSLKGIYFWTMSPGGYSADYADGTMVRGYNGHLGGEDTDGRSSGSRVTFKEGVRPVITLIPEIEFISGDGSKGNPYIVKTD